MSNGERAPVDCVRAALADRLLNLYTFSFFCFSFPISMFPSEAFRGGQTNRREADCNQLAWFVAPRERHVKGVL